MASLTRYVTILILISGFQTLVTTGYHWKAWTQWSDCSGSCDEIGHRIRQRTCIDSDHSEEVSATLCRGSPKARRKCRLHCVKDLEWATWAPWSPCSVTCGSGFQRRLANCTTVLVNLGPTPSRRRNINCNMTDIDEDILACDAGTCPPVDGGWSEWKPITACSACLENNGSYVNGTRMETRWCTEPQPEHGGVWCKGMPIRMTNCSTKDCPVWSEWSNWTDCPTNCSAEVQRPVKTRKKECIKLPTTFPFEKCAEDVPVVEHDNCCQDTEYPEIVENPEGNDTDDCDYYEIPENANGGGLFGRKDYQDFNYDDQATKAPLKRCKSDEDDNNEYEYDYNNEDYDPDDKNIFDF